MYICKDCKHVFDDDKVVIIRDDPSPQGVGLPAGYYTYYECPHCGSEDIAEAAQCVVCGEYYDSPTGSDGVCDECFAEIEGNLETVREDAGLSYQQFKEVLNELY